MFRVDLKQKNSTNLAKINYSKYIYTHIPVSVYFYLLNVVKSREILIYVYIPLFKQNLNMEMNALFHFLFYIYMHRDTCMIHIYKCVIDWFFSI